MAVNETRSCDYERDGHGALPPCGLDTADWTADHLVAVIERYLSEEHRDFKAVVGALHLLALKDPHRAQLLLDVFDLARTASPR